jgi:NADPH:quinone reductase-like Zn-dependent oxidoreductase
VLVRVIAAGLNPLDNAIAAGMMTGMVEHDYPVVLGRDAAGIVERVGDGVDGISVGDAVVGHVLLAPPVKQGTLAEYAVLPSAAVVRKPDELDFATAAAIPLSGAAAVAAVDAIDPQPGEAVLIVGASGGVGSYAVQLAAGRGAIVIATGLPEDEDRLRDLGAGHVVDYRENLAEQVRRAYLGAVQGLIDLVSYSPDVLAEHASLLEEGGASRAPWAPRTRRPWRP